MRNPVKYDPTRTTMLRNSFVRDVKKRFRVLKKSVFELLVTEDAFALRKKKDPFVINTRFEFLTDPEKAKAYQAWFKEQVDLGLLEIADGVDPAKPWTAEYVQSGYKKGVTRAYIEAKGASLTAAAGFVEGSKAQFLETAFGGPIGTKQLELLSMRTFEQLKGITAAMSQEIARDLTAGLAHGHGPRKIATQMHKTIDGITKKRAVVMARTEIIHAYAEGQLDSLEQLGIPEVTAFVEWSTARDDRVCPLCLPLEGVVMTLKEARGILPRHPNCRCAWIPVIDKVSKGHRQRLQKSINKSVRAERRGKRSSKQARSESVWKGADVAPLKKNS